MSDLTIGDGKNIIMQLPLEILIMIMEMLEFRDALLLCSALNIPEELAVQYHIFVRETSYIFSLDFEITLRLSLLFNKPFFNASCSKALLENAGFRSLATAVRFAILSQDLELVKYALQDPEVDHDDMKNSPLLEACTFGEAGIIEYILSNADINSTVYFSAFKIGRCPQIDNDSRNSKFSKNSEDNRVKCSFWPNCTR